MKNNNKLVPHKINYNVYQSMFDMLDKESAKNENTKTMKSVFDYNIDYFNNKEKKVEFTNNVIDQQETEIITPLIEDITNEQEIEIIKPLVEEITTEQEENIRNILAPLSNLNDFTTSTTTTSSVEIQGNIEEEDIVCTETRNTFQEQDINSLITEKIIKEAENERVNTIRELSNICGTHTTDIASNLFNLNISSIGNGLIVLVGTGLLSYYLLTRSDRSNNNTTIDGEDRTLFQANVTINQPNLNSDEGIIKKTFKWLGKKLFKK